MFLIEGFRVLLRRGKTKRIPTSRFDSLEAAVKLANEIFAKFGIVVTIIKDQKS